MEYIDIYIYYIIIYIGLLWTRMKQYETMTCLLRILGSFSLFCIRMVTVWCLHPASVPRCGEHQRYPHSSYSPQVQSEPLGLAEPEAQERIG